MTLYRHFASKDGSWRNICARWASVAISAGAANEAAHPGDDASAASRLAGGNGRPLRQSDDRGCALANAAVELPDKAHPARRVIEELKLAQRDRLAELARKAGLSEPEMLADELYLLLEGARSPRKASAPKVSAPADPHGRSDDCVACERQGLARVAVRATPVRAGNLTSRSLPARRAAWYQAARSNTATVMIG